jgi:hypothetical protein
MGTLSLLNLSSNGLTRGTLKTDTRVTLSKRLGLGDKWGSKDDHYESDMQGVIALANAIPDMGAMTSLNLANNFLQAEGAKHIAGALKVSKCVLAIILAPLASV